MQEASSNLKAHWLGINDVIDLLIGSPVPFRRGGYRVKCEGVMEKRGRRLREKGGERGKERVSNWKRERAMMPTSFWVVVSVNCLVRFADSSMDILSPWEPLSCEQQLGRCLGYEREPRPPSGMRRLICKRICDCECLHKMYMFMFLYMFELTGDVCICADEGWLSVYFWRFRYPCTGRWNEGP